MRAREFIREQRELPPESAEPMRNTFILPGLSSADPYKNYRLGVAVARARSDLGQDHVDANKFKPVWSAETAFGEHAVVVGFNDTVDDVIDLALKMTNTPGSKKLVSSANSLEPRFVSTQSPIKGFKGYPK